MKETKTERTAAQQANLAKLAHDLEVAGNTLISLIKMAERTLAAEEAGIETLVQVMGRYASDLPKLTQQLLELNR
nr:hypothetical protein [Herbaspirillum sp. ASV7]